MRIDWPHIKNKIFGVSVDADTPYLFVIPHGGRHLLLAMTERLKWRATFRTDGYDYSDWDDLQAVVAATEQGLMGETKMSDLIDILTQIYNAIRALQQRNEINIDACCENANPTPDPGIEVGDGEPPNEYGDEPIQDWDEYQAYLCAAALKWVESMERALRDLGEAVDNGLIVIGGIAALLGLLALIGIIISVSFGLAAALFGAIVALVAGDALEEAADWFRDNKQDIANVIYCSPTAEIAADNVKQYIQDHVSAEAWSVLKWFDYQNNMNIIFAGKDADGNTVDVQPSTSCSCTQETGYFFINLPDGHLQKEDGTAVYGGDPVIAGIGYHVVKPLDPWATEFGFGWGELPFLERDLHVRVDMDGWIAHPTGTGCNEGWAIRVVNEAGETFGQQHNGTPPPTPFIATGKHINGCYQGNNNPPPPTTIITFSVI